MALPPSLEAAVRRVRPFLGLAEVAAFVADPTSAVYAASCREFGVDPAAGIEDPWLAAQLRIGLFYRVKRDEYDAMEEERKRAEGEGRRDEHRERIDKARNILTGRTN